jgi:hypothetical protein
MPEEHKNEALQGKGGTPLILFPEIIGFFALPFLFFKELLAGHSLAGSVGLILWFFGLLFLLVCIRRRRYFLAGLPILVLFGLYLLAHRVIGS